MPINSTLRQATTRRLAQLRWAICLSSLVLVFGPLRDAHGQAHLLVKTHVRQDVKQSSIVAFPDSSERRVAVLGANQDKVSLRAVLIGAVIGGTIGGFVGHQVDGGGYSCPTSPNFPCKKQSHGTALGVISGALIGGLAGAFISSRR
jgi:outer membrane lipoprotein SlyB